MISVSIVAIPLVLTVLGIMLNSLRITHDQPEYSSEKDPAKGLAAERQANYRYFYLQKVRLLKRQKRIGEYGWLILIASIASSLWQYSDVVKKPLHRDKSSRSRLCR
ncbi:MAG: hypothetical protein ACREO5_01090 [Candidatus Binatia bacterium]